jgi:ubiquinone/menaquinone biosynthesis C-methylase UbiE
MTKPRIPETNYTILGCAHVEGYDRMQAALRENGWLETEYLLLNGIVSGFALEVGSGPGYLGLEWLLRTRDTHLVGLDISPDMIAIAKNHARELGLTDRAEHLLGSAEAIPFEDNAFDAVFTVRSLHEWLNPCTIFTELWRVLKPGGRLYVSDLRRDLSRKVCNFLEQWVKSEVILKSLRASIGAAYTMAEVIALLNMTELVGCEVVERKLGLQVTGIKPA